MDRSQFVSRRDFLKTTGSAMAVLGASSSSKAASTAATIQRSRVAVVGTGVRGIGMWGSPVVRDYSDRVAMVGLCDINPKRVELARRLIESGVSDMDGLLSSDERGASNSPGSGDIRTFTDFDEMVRTVEPDRIIVTTMDSAHVPYVVHALELGRDVICEKPLAVDEEQCQSVIDAEKRFGGDITVTFNARYGSSATAVKELLEAGEIGELYSVDYAEYLDTIHGASYFRRWHGIKENSGTLLVHKASHHFDQLNWWIGSDPEEVSAFGELRRYGRKGPFRHANCRACTFKAECPYYWDITESPYLVELYVNCESEDGYYRDGCVYRNAINIYDTMSVQVRYVNKVLVTYSLNAGVPLEGQIIVFNGSKGRIEVRNYARQPFSPPARAEVRLMRNFENESTLVPLAEREGSHGGSDRLIRDHIFVPEAPDPLGQRAGARAGVMSSIIGIAAYRSIERRRPVRVDELIEWS